MACVFPPAPLWEGSRDVKGVCPALSGCGAEAAGHLPEAGAVPWEDEGLRPMGFSVVESASGLWHGVHLAPFFGLF